MNAVRRQLMPSETLLWQGRQDWTVALGAPLAVCIVGLPSMSLFAPGSPWAGAALFAWLVALIWLPAAFLNWRAREFAITDRRVLRIQGVLGRSYQDLPRATIETVAVRQTLAGRIQGFGSLELTATGGARLTLPDIRHPEQQRALLYERPARSIPGSQQ